jgi:hypothetical protein
MKKFGTNLGGGGRKIEYKKYKNLNLLIKFLFIQIHKHLLRTRISYILSYVYIIFFLFLIFKLSKTLIKLSINIVMLQNKKTKTL